MLLSMITMMITGATQRTMKSNTQPKTKYRIGRAFCNTILAKMQNNSIFVVTLPLEY